MVRFGVRNGRQRYQCKVCKRTETDGPENPLVNLRVPMDKAIQVVSLLCEGMGIRPIERLTGLNRRTVLNILNVAGEKAAAFQQAKVWCVEAAIVEADEMSSFVTGKSIRALMARFALCSGMKSITPPKPNTLRVPVSICPVKSLA